MLAWFLCSLACDTLLPLIPSVLVKIHTHNEKKDKKEHQTGLSFRAVKGDRAQTHLPVQQDSSKTRPTVHLCSLISLSVPSTRSCHVCHPQHPHKGCHPHRSWHLLPAVLHVRWYVYLCPLLPSESTGRPDRITRLSRDRCRRRTDSLSGTHHTAHPARQYYEQTDRQKSPRHRTSTRSDQLVPIRLMDAVLGIVIIPDRKSVV